MRAAGTERSPRHRAQRRGAFAESLCRWYLRLRGWRIVASGWRCPSGEIDILAIIEVKARRDLASAALSVLPRQRRRIARAASAFLLMRPDLAELVLRFDVMLVAPARLPRHLPDAWRIDG